MAQTAAAYCREDPAQHPSPTRFRVAMIAACPMPARRGTPLRIERLTEALNAQGHRVEVITYHVADDDHQLDFPVHRILKKRRFGPMPAGPNARKLFLYSPLLAAKLWKVVGNGGFDVIHAHHIEGLLASLPGKMRFGVPIVYDAHTLLGAELPSYVPQGLRAATRVAGNWLDGLLPRCADHIAAVTPEIRDNLIHRHGLPAERISVVMNGVETGRFLVDEIPATDGVVRIFYSGTMAPYQDIDLLLEAFARARRSRQDLRLWLSVSSTFEPYEAHARQLGIRDAIDLCPDGFDVLPARLAACSMAVLPRTNCPGIPQKLLNYMAAGKGIVASAGSAKVLEHERNGLIVPNGDVDAFALAMLRLANDVETTRRLGHAARLDVEQQYTWDRAAVHLGEIYQTLLRGRQGMQTTSAARY